MHILILSLAYAPFSGVGAARMTSLSQYLLEKDEKVTVICYDSRVFGEGEQLREVPAGVQRIIVDRLPGKKENQNNLKKAIERAVQENHFDICISSVGPFETMFFIKEMWTRWKIPYVIDYRDPWIFVKDSINLRGLYKMKVFIYDCLCYFIEKQAIKNAAKIVTVTEKSKADIVRMHHISPEKCQVIYNGYENVPANCKVPDREEYVIGIAGKFAEYNLHAAEDFITVCEEISGSIPVKIIRIGKEEDSLKGRYSKAFSCVGEKSYGDTMEELAKADALLICYSHQIGLGTKVFDYIALNKPIIYVGVVPSELAEFVGQFENSYICNDKQQMHDSLTELMQDGSKVLTLNDVDKFSREKQNEEYMLLIKELCEKAAGYDLRAF